MPSSSAIAAACSGPAPPKASSANPRGSRPRSTVITRSARTISAFATRRMPAAHSATGIPSAAASAPTAAARPPRGPGGRRRRAACAGSSVPEHDVGVGHRRLGAAARRTRPGPGTAPADRGPTRSAPPASRQAIDPPPAPTVWMSTIGSAIGRPAISRPGALAHAAALDDAHVAGRAAHVEAQEVRLAARLPDERRRRRAARRAREDRQDRVARRRVRVDQAAAGLHDLGVREAARRRALAQTAQVGAQQRGERGIDLRRRGPLVLAERADDLVRERDVDRVAEPLADRGGDRELVRRVAPGVQQADRDRLGPAPAPARPPARSRPRCGERLQHVARAPSARRPRSAARAARSAPGARRTAGRAPAGSAGRARRRP